MGVAKRAFVVSTWLVVVKTKTCVCGVEDRQVTRSSHRGLAELEL